MDQDNKVEKPLSTHQSKSNRQTEQAHQTKQAELSASADVQSSLINVNSKLGAPSKSVSLDGSRVKASSKRTPRKTKPKKESVNYAELLASFKTSCEQAAELKRKAKAARDSNPDLTPDHKIHYLEIEDLEAVLDKCQDCTFPENWHIDMLEHLDNIIDSEERMVMEQGGYDEGWYWDNDLNLSPEKEIKLASLLASSTMPYAKAYTAKRAKIFLEYKEHQRRKAAGKLSEEELLQDLIESQYNPADDPNDEFHYYGYHDWDLSHIAWPADLRRIDYGLVHDMASAAVTAHVDVFYLRKVIDGKDMFLNWLDTVDFIGLVPTQGFKFHKSGTITFCTTSTQLSLVGCQYRLVDMLSFNVGLVSCVYPLVHLAPLTKDNALPSYKQRIVAKDTQEAQDIANELKVLASYTMLFSQAPRFDYETYRHGKPFMLRHVSWQWPYVHPYERDASYGLALVQDCFYSSYGQASLLAWNYLRQENSFKSKALETEQAKTTPNLHGVHIDQAGYHIEPQASDLQPVVYGEGVSPILHAEQIDSGSAAVRMSVAVAKEQLKLHDNIREPLIETHSFNHSFKESDFFKANQGQKLHPLSQTKGAEEQTTNKLHAKLEAMFGGKEQRITTYEQLRQIFLMCASNLACVLDSVSERLLYKYCKVVSADSDDFYVSICFNSQGVITKVTTEQVSYAAQACLKNLSLLLGFKIAPKLAKLPQDKRAVSGKTLQDSSYFKSQVVQGQGQRPWQGEHLEESHKFAQGAEQGNDQNHPLTRGGNPPDMQQVLREAHTLVQTQEQLDSIVANFLAAKQAQQALEQEQAQQRRISLARNKDGRASKEQDPTHKSLVLDKVTSLATSTPTTPQSLDNSLHIMDRLGPEFEDASLLLQAQRPNIDESAPSWKCFGRVVIPVGLSHMPPKVVNGTMSFAQLVQILLNHSGFKLEGVVECKNQKVCTIYDNPASPLELKVHYTSTGKITKVTCKARADITQHLSQTLVGKYLVEDLDGLCAVKPCTGQES